MLVQNLLREDAPLAPNEWNSIDQAVVNTAKERLVCRRFISVFGPLGAGVQAICQDIFAGVDAGQMSLLGEEDIHPVHAETRSFKPIPIIYKDFVIHWRDI
ncbi:MAG TPA: bacteriocin, partial [Armatimonadetes bacterium]|nr:bacteriocin [Armatimonadota bacterium]